MLRISLITVTMGDRPGELARLRSSLGHQTYRNFEHIVINQREHPEFRGGLSRARNYGLTLATGDVVAFPDDDAWYAPTVLSDVVEVLSDDSIDGVSFRVTDESGVCSAGGWMGESCKLISHSNVWHTAVSCSFFIKRSAIGDLQFDERLGVGSGTQYGSGEDTDFILCAIEHGAKILYDGSKCIFHPTPSWKNRVSKGWLYGNGYGVVLRRHRYTLARLSWAIGVQLVRAFQSFLFLDFRKAMFHCAMSFGRLCGYIGKID